MRAAFIEETGGVEKIRVGELPAPVPGATEVLVKVEYAAVNHVDMFVRSGAYATELPFPFPMGRDMVGVVVQSHLQEFPVGARVWTNSMGYDGRPGTFAEYAAVPRERLFLVPDAVKDTRQVVAAAHGFSTAYLALKRYGNISAGDTLMIGGASGAVCSVAVQLARESGARVIATASPKHHDYVLSLGAEQVFDYHRDDLFEALSQAAPQGYDTWWDNGGNHDFEAVLPLLAPRGELVLSANMAARPVLPVGAVYTNAVTVRGFAMSVASVDDLAAAARSLGDLMSRGKLTARWEKTFDLDDAAAAHRALEDGAVPGKILVKVA